jgi:flagellum-specific peptidoglycan hydrolase FlgJ
MPLIKTFYHKRWLFYFFNYRRLLLPIFLSLVLNSGFAQAKSFIKKFRPMADSLSIEYSIPASVILGVSMIESGSGTSRNCKLLNNYFGMAGKNKLYKTKGIKTRYKQYPDALSSFDDFCKLVKKKKFYKKLKGNNDYKLWIDAISKSNYSEIPLIWKQRVLEAIRKNKLHATLRNSGGKGKTL